MHELKFDNDYVLRLTERILQTDSPSGYTQDVMALIGAETAALGLPFEKTRKGGGVITLAGESGGPALGVCAHVDTLGLMVRSVKTDGKLAFTRIGGPILSTLDGEYCRVRTRDGRVYTGTILSTSPAAHVYTDANDKARQESTMEIRLDEIVKSRGDTAALGVAAGDYICIDPKVVITPSGFIKSRFLDDKLSVGLLFGVLKAFVDAKARPARDVKVLISAYEEVGHGMAYIPFGISELLAVDMGCIGEDLACTEYDVSICAKDSSGPYDYAMTTRLVTLAREHGIPYALDIYPYYGSDVSAALKAGNDVRGALIGPGVHASHGMERAHTQGVEATMRLTALYMLARG